MDIYIHMNDLENLQCILDTIYFEDIPSFFTEENTIDFFETAFQLMDEYMTNNPTIISEPDFKDILLDEIKELFLFQFEEQLLSEFNDDFEEDLDEMLDCVFHIYTSTFSKERSFQNTEFNNINNANNQYNQNDQSNQHNIKEIDWIEMQINKLRNIPQPVQRTDEWYKFRHNLITASNAYKAFETQATVNQLIYDKCQPLKTNTENDENMEVKVVNTTTTLHWGQKYEPLSVLLYEEMYNVTVEDFGCIQHNEYSFLGASPDGIIVSKHNERYGRMLEIKNIVNRVINGIPKKEYWIQMQLQMEVCDLNTCDFLETKFVEYSDSSEFYEDTKIDPLLDCTCSKQDKTKGIIIHFHTKEGKPLYEYKPLRIKGKEEMEKWEEDTILKNESLNGHTFMKIIYWKVEIMSCVLVLRDKDWFKNNISQLKHIWEIIEYERIHGYEHRAPNRKQKKEAIKPVIKEETSMCLLSVKK